VKYNIKRKEDRTRRKLKQIRNQSTSTRTRKTAFEGRAALEEACSIHEEGRTRTRKLSNDAVERNGNAKYRKEEC